MSEGISVCDLRFAARNCNMSKYWVTEAPTWAEDVALHIEGTDYHDAFEIRSTPDALYLCPPPAYEPELSGQHHSSDGAKREEEEAKRPRPHPHELS